MAKLCPNPHCSKENPTAANVCMFCGTRLVEIENLSEEDRLRKELSDMQETIRLLKKALADAQHNNDSSVESLRTIKNLKRQLDDMQNRNKTLHNLLNASSISIDKKSFPITMLVAGLLLLFVAGGLVGYFVFFYERNTERYYYTFAEPNALLRSSPEMREDNILKRLPYGTILFMYNKGDEWSKVKWEDTQSNESKKGYIASDLILPKYDYQILNAIWGDNESKEIIKTVKCRNAVLNYFKQKGYLGSWRIYSKSENMESGVIYYEWNINKNSNFAGFAVIIKNAGTGERKCLLFSFYDDKTTHLVYEENAPLTGGIAGINCICNIKYQ